MELAELKKPVVTHNRDLRKKAPEITEFFEAAKIEASSLPQVNGVVRDPALVDWRACPVCENSQTTQLFLKWGFLYHECEECSHIFIKNPIREGRLLDIYSTSKTETLGRSKKHTDEYERYWTELHRKYLRVLSFYGKKDGKLIDVGAGGGGFLDLCKSESAFELHATEFADDAKDFLESLTGKENFYHRQKIEDINFKGKKFDVLTLWGVLEHVYNPFEVLNKCGQSIADDGLILILVPNIQSRAIKMLGITTPTLNPRAHIHNYTRRSFEKLAGKCGLKVVDSFGELPVIDLMYDHMDFSPEAVEDIIRRNETYYNVFLLSKG